MSRILLYEEEVIDALRSKISEFIPYMNGPLEKLPLECEIAIRKLKQAQPPWIPIKEDHPKESGLYIVTLSNGEVTFAIWDMIETLKFLLPLGYNEYSVVAWMSKPKPYKEERNDTD